MSSYIAKNFIDCSQIELENILDWRNEANIRENSFNSDIISRENHFNYIKSLKNRKDRFYNSL